MSILAGVILFCTLLLVVCGGLSDGPGVWRMTPSDTHRVVEANSTLTITCTYTYKDDVENRHKNLSWKWELPPFLTKYPQVFKYIIRLIILPIIDDISHL